MQRRSFLATLGTGGVALAGCTAPSAVAGDPVAVFEAFVAAHERGDLAELRGFVHPDSQGGDISAADVEGMAGFTFDIEGTELVAAMDETALVRADVTVTTSDGEAYTHERLAELRPADGTWRIWWVAFDHEALSPRATFSFELDGGVRHVTAEGPDSCFAHRTFIKRAGGLERWGALGGDASGWLDGERAVQPGDRLTLDGEQRSELAVVWRHLDGEREVLGATDR